MNTNPPIYFREDDLRYYPFCLSHTCTFTSSPTGPGNTAPPGVCCYFTSLTQYLQYRKALFFYDHRAAEDILTTSDVSLIMSISRRINGLQVEVWNGMRNTLVREGLMLKFGQNEELRRLLLDTGDRELVYASGTRDWGVGFAPTDAGKSRDSWGLNLLGQALMDVRRRLREYADATGTYPKARPAPIDIKMNSLVELQGGS
ncbi:unnamed protein product [Tuber melanosporum]|uniref:(Perigord truffle) hypothetical protein n=1 Tax=Tuber melanosporum (strain Mel28) TaxID=656061 RepID=D5G9J1_TUBMM|nr:uncharacterized protein GSTUM_00003347001 [Tuber melanosporum]KAG0123959.1 hypothetical protein HOY82DRAFT_209706 [Tuber indicum]CAZ81184.1 unnamed protein product [Tuber melanosporum]